MLQAVEKATGRYAETHAEQRDIHLSIMNTICPLAAIMQPTAAPEAADRGTVLMRLNLLFS